MTFARITKQTLFSELRERADNGPLICPSLAWITKQCRLDGPDRAEALLIEMARDGELDVIRGGEYPWVSVKRVRYGGDRVAGVQLDPERWDKLAASEPVVIAVADLKVAPASRSTAERHESETLTDDDSFTPAITFARVVLPSPWQRTPLLADEATALLAAIDQYCARTGMLPNRFGHELFGHGGFVALLRRRGTASLEAANAAYEAIGLPVIERTPKLDQRIAATTQSVAKPIRHAGDVRSRQIAIFITPETYDELRKRAATAGIAPGRVAANILIEATSSIKSPPERPHIRGEVTRAWQHDGRPFGEFIGELIELGLSAHLAGRGQ